MKTIREAVRSVSTLPCYVKYGGHVYTLYSTYIYQAWGAGILPIIYLYISSMGGMYTPYNLPIYIKHKGHVYTLYSTYLYINIKHRGHVYTLYSTYNIYIKRRGHVYTLYSTYLYKA